MGCTASKDLNDNNNIDGVVISSDSNNRNNNNNSPNNMHSGTKDKIKKLEIPIPKEGYLMKEGHQVKNWKKRYFVLTEGKLTYYVEYKEGKYINEKGKLDLIDYMVMKGFHGNDNRTILLQHNKDKSKDFVLEAHNSDDRILWDHALRAHISYALLLDKSYEP